MADVTLSAEELETLKQNLLAGLAKIEKMQEGMSYTDEEKNGSFERYSDEELSELKEEIGAGFNQDSKEKVEKKELTREKALLEKQKELRDKQRALKKLKRSIFVKEQKERLSDECDKILQQIKDTSKMYGAKAQKCAEDYLSAKEGKKSIIEEYKVAREEIDVLWQKDQQENQRVLEELQATEESQSAIVSNYINKRNRAMQQKDERKIQLAKEIQAAIEKEDIHTIAEKTKELREIKRKASRYDEKIYEETNTLCKIRADIEDCKQLMDERDELANQQYMKILDIKNEKVAGLAKQNVFQKTIGFIINKFNGAKKFSNNVINKIKEKIDSILTEELPKTQAEMEQSSEEREAREEKYDEQYWSEQVSQIVESEKDNEAERSEEVEATEEPKKSKQQIKEERKAARAKRREEKYNETMKALEDRIATAEQNIQVAQARFTGQLDTSRE